MVAQTTPHNDLEPNPKGPATTTAEAKANKSPYLCLSSLKLVQLPEGIEKLSNLTNLDISNNKFTTIPEESLPSGLVELTVTGCQLTELPARIGTLPRLRKLFAGANKLHQVDAVFRSSSLQHVGLAYNRVAVLPAEAVLSESSLLSVDLSHNDLEGLVATLTQLAALPSLAALGLSGNPLALSPRYTLETRGRLKQLLYLDGQRMDLPANSRPGTANSATGLSSSGRQMQNQPSQRGQLANGSGLLAPIGSRSLTTAFSLHQTVRFEDAAGGGDRTAVMLTLRGLQPAEDPFAWLKARWDEQISTAEELGMTVPPTLEIPVPPLQPVIYHLEMADMEGTPLACIPLKLVPPTPPDVAVMFDPKARAAAAAAAAKEAKKAGKPTTPKGKKGKAAVVSTEQVVQRQLETGLLRVTLPLQAAAEQRNWLRSGTTVTMYKTTLTAVARPTTAAESVDGGRGAAAKQGAGPKKKKGEEAPAIEYNITSSTAVVGSAVLRAGSQVVDGYTLEGSERLDFLPPPPLFDERGIRLALKDPHHSSQPVGHVDVSVQLHVPLHGPAG